jgi:hypothetical protein
MHRLLKTQNSDYYLIDNECIAVRDQREGSWSRRHSAVGAKLVGSIRVDGPIQFTPAQAQMNGRLMFSNDVMTSPVCFIGEPEPATRCELVSALDA